MATDQRMAVKMDPSLVEAVQVEKTRRREEGYGFFALSDILMEAWQFYLSNRDHKMPREMPNVISETEGAWLDEVLRLMRSEPAELNDRDADRRAMLDLVLRGRKSPRL